MIDNPIQYKVSFVEGDAKEGTSSRIVVRDDLNVITISNHYAPLITVLQNGRVSIFESNTLKEEIPYQEGFLRCQNNVCMISILK